MPRRLRRRWLRLRGASISALFARCCCPDLHSPSCGSLTSHRQCPKGQYGKYPTDENGHKSPNIECLACPTGTICVRTGVTEDRLEVPLIDSLFLFDREPFWLGWNRKRACLVLIRSPSQSMQAAPGYWRLNNNSAEFMRCLRPGHCLGGENSACGGNREGQSRFLCVCERLSSCVRAPF